MNKKLAASLTIAIFLMSTLAILAPVQADFTLGQNQPNYPFTIQNFDPHVNGVIGYVWPGGGENTYAGAPTTVSPLLSPGYVAPYPANAVKNAVGWTQNVEQLDGDEYAPSGAIVTNSTGDLIFAINYTSTGIAGTSGQFVPSPYQVYDNLYIAIPPEFSGPGIGMSDHVVTTITNNYNNIGWYKLSPYDRFAPGWSLLKVTADPSALMHFNNGQWYYVRINGVKAPAVAGKYFFKMYLYYSQYGVGTGVNPGGTFGPISQPSGSSISYPSACTAFCPPRVQYFLPTQNWPVLLVKGELDPAIITGTIRYGGYNSTLYGQPIMEAGEVTAVMTTKLDPYTGAQLTGPLTNAMGYFNSTTCTPYVLGQCNPTTATVGSGGHYEVEGVAPGIYNLYASAAGYPTALIASNVQVLKGQSLHFDGYLNPGPVIHGTVFSKHSFGSEPWPFYGDTVTQTSNVGGEYIKIELYNSPTVNNAPSSNATMVSWSPLPCVAGGQNNYYPGNDAGVGIGLLNTGQSAPYEGCGDPRFANTVAFPYHDSPGGAGAVFAGPTSSADPQGVGPAQNWYVKADGVNDQFSYEFGSKGEYGAPSQLDGHVPQLYATWVNGLTPGRYYARAWVFRYVQTALDGSTFQEYSFQVTPNEWAGDISLPMDLRISSWVNKTVHFHDNAGTLSTNPISTGSKYLAGGLYDANNVLWSYNVTSVTYLQSAGTSYPSYLAYGQLSGSCASPTAGVCTSGAAGTYGTYSAATPVTYWQTNLPGKGTALDKAGLNVGGNCALGNCNIQFWGYNDTWLGENYGIPAGTYTPKVSALGYIQQTFDKVSLTLSGTPVQISNHLYRGVGFNMTAYSIDWEQPRVNRNWVYPGNDIGMGIYNAANNAWISFVANTATQSANSYYTEFHGAGAGNANYVYFGLNPGQTPTTSAYTRYGGKLNSAAREFTEATAKNIWNTGGNGWNLPGLSYGFPSAFDSGSYKFQGWSYGYIQDKDFVVSANKGQIADIKVNLIIGVNVTLDILFKKEGIISPTANNMSARVRVFDDYGNLVGTWMSSEGVYTSSITGQTLATAGSNTAAYPWDGGYNYLPAGINQLHVDVAGLPYAPTSANKANGGASGVITWPQYYIPPGYTGINVYPLASCAASLQNCFVTYENNAAADTHQNWNGQAQGTKYGDPVFSPYGQTLNLNSFPSDYWSVPNAHFPNEGILGQPDYSGTGYTAEVDFVNWYQGTPAVTFSGTVSYGSTPQQGETDTCTAFCPSYYYPVVPGLLMGESYHIVPGTLAKSGISLTEDAAALSTYYGSEPGASVKFPPHSMSMNHLGPYSQLGVWTLGPAHLSGETSAIYEVDLNGYVSGTALAFTWSNELKAISWYTVNVQGAGNATFNSYTTDGIYEFYLLPGTYSMTISGPGYKATPLGSISVTSGQTATPGAGNNVGLPQTNIPVPEFSGIAVVAFSALAASLYLIRRRRQ